MEVHMRTYFVELAVQGTGFVGFICIAEDSETAQKYAEDQLTADQRVAGVELSRCEELLVPQVWGLGTLID
jgi:hypothetical protein